LAMGFLDSALTDTLASVPPGRNRVIVFADLDRDSTFSAIPESLVASRFDTLLLTLGDAAGDTTGFYLEPWRTLEPVTIEPGLLTRFAIRAGPFTLTPWTAPEAKPDTASAARDTLAVREFGNAPADTLAVPAPDSTLDAVEDSTAIDEEQ